MIFTITKKLQALSRFFLLAFTLSLVACVSTGFKSEKVFSEHYLEFLVSSVPHLQPQYENALVLRLTDGEILSLQESYAIYLEQPEQLKEIISNDVRKQLGALGKTETLYRRDNVVPVLYPQSKGTALCDDLLPEVSVCYGFDTPVHRRFLRAEDLSRLQLVKKDLFTLALANLERFSSPKQRLGDGSPYLYLTGGAYEAAQVLEPDFAEQFQTSGAFRVQGELVVLAAARDTLFVLGSTDQKARDKVRAYLKTTQGKRQFWLTDKAWVWREGRWQIFELEK